MKKPGLTAKFQIPIIIIGLLAMAASMVFIQREMRIVTEEQIDIAKAALEVEHQAFEEALSAELATKGRVLGTFMSKTAADLIITYDLDSMRSHESQAATDEDIAYAFYLRPDGSSFTGAKVPPDSPKILRQQFPILQGKEVLGHVLVGMSTENLSRGINNSIARGNVAIEQVRAGGIHALSQFYAISMAVGAVAFFSVAIVIYLQFRVLVTGQLHKTIKLMKELTERDGTISERLPVRDNDELGEMAFTFNVMVDTLQQYRRQEEENSARLANANEKLSHLNKRLRENNDELKSFTFVVSHDLREPLVNIKGFSEEIREAIITINRMHKSGALTGDEGAMRTFETLLRVDIKEALDYIGSSITTMDRLISSILELSRLGYRKLKPETVEVSKLIEGLLPSLQTLIKSSGAEIRIGDMPTIMTDRISMEQIIINLLDNALKYLQPGRYGEIHISAEREKNVTIFHITDNGRGIPEHDLGKIFEPFRKGGNHDEKGEGIGLAAVKALVRRHGGNIWCKSTIGSGTTFSFSMPDDIAGCAEG